MWPVSARFLDALSSPHRIETVVTVTPPGGAPQNLALKSGNVSSDAGTRIRRKAALEVFATAENFEAITADGAMFQITHGINFGSTSELVPIFTGELVDGTQTLGDGSSRFNLADHMNWITRARYTTPFSPVPGTPRRSVIATAVTTGKAGTIVNDIASDTGVVGTSVWTDSRSDTINAMATDGGMDAFFQPDGSFLIRDKPSLTSSPAWSVSAGTAGTLKTATRRRPKDRLYNTVIVKPSTTEQTWAPQVVSVSDPQSPRHPSKIGVVPYFWASPSITDEGTALAAAYRMLERVQGTTETLELGAISNPALDAGDVIRIITPNINQQPAQIFQHFIDSITLDLVDGSMQVGTRSQGVDDDQ